MTRMLLFLIFFPKETAEDTPPALVEANKPRYRDAVAVVAISFAHFFVLVVLSVVFYATHMLTGWANFLGLMAAGLACIQYIPQIYTTWHLGAVKSLSIPMMCIQTPGSYVFAASLYIRLGSSGWSAWGVYVVTGALQACLLVMGIAFEYRDWKARKALDDETRRNTEYNGRRSTDSDEDEEDPDEDTPLLSNGTSPTNYTNGDGTTNGDASNGDGSGRKGHDTLRKSKLSIVQNADD